MTSISSLHSYIDSNYQYGDIRATFSIPEFSKILDFNLVNNSLVLLYQHDNNARNKSKIVNIILYRDNPQLSQYILFTYKFFKSVVNINKINSLCLIFVPQPTFKRGNSPGLGAILLVFCGTDFSTK